MIRDASARAAALRVIGPALWLVLALSCQRGSAPALLSIEWPAQETANYSLAVDSIPTGRYELALRSLDTLGTPALELVSYTRLYSAGDVASDSAVVLMRRADLAPLRSHRTVSTTSGSATAQVIWSAGRAAVTRRRGDEQEEQISLRIDRRTCDFDALTTLLRVLAVPPDTVVALQALSGLAGYAVPVRVRQLPDERAVVPAGDFSCRRLKMNLLGRDVDLWYEPGGARRLVRYLDPGARMVMELLPPPVADTAVSPGS
jgi:hypothetical protein